MTLDSDLIIRLLGYAGITGVTAAALVWGALKLYGEKWLENKFAMQLNDLKHAQEVELRELGFKIAALLDRKTKLNQYEFEALPIAWKLINDAFHKTAVLTSRVQRQSDLSGMSKIELAAFLRDSKLKSLEQDEVLGATDPSVAYNRYNTHYRYLEVQSAVRAAYVCSLESAIFFDAEVNQKFKELHDRIFEASTEFYAYEFPPVFPRVFERQDYLRANGEAMLRELEDTVRKKLLSA